MVRLRLYTDCYDGIRSCLSIQYYAPAANVSDAVKQKAIDEGRFVQALFYYLLVNNYGGVPLVTEYASTAIKKFLRVQQLNKYTYIIDELKSIISNNRLTSSSATKAVKPVLKLLKHCWQRLIFLLHGI